MGMVALASKLMDQAGKLAFVAPAAGELPARALGSFAMPFAVR